MMIDAKKIRIDNVQAKLKVVQLSALSILIFNCLGIAFSVYTFLSLNDILNSRSGADLLQKVRNDFSAYQAMERNARENMTFVRQMDNLIDFEESENNIVSAATVLHNSERDFQLFFRLLKVNLYHLTGEIPGSSSWYELYGPEIDQAIERSRSRQLQLLTIQQSYDDSV